MFKMLRKCLLIISLFFIVSLFAETSSAELVQGCIDKIRQLPEARELITTIQKEGPIRFAISEHELGKKFGAYWDVDQRVICINPEFHESEGRIIGSMLFEMQNAFSTAVIEKLYDLVSQGKMDKETFIRSMEFQEYTNSKRAAAMAQRGIDLGIFPKSALLPTYSNFEEHYHYQKIGGHSAWFAKYYDQMAPK